MKLIELTRPADSFTAVAPSQEHQQPHRYFPDDLVVTYTASGEVASRFGDNTWDMTAFSTDGTSRQTLHFYKSGEPAEALSDLAQKIRQQHKALMWLHMDAGKNRAWKTLQNTNQALNRWCAWAEEKGIDLYALLTNPEALAEYSQRLNINYLYLTFPAIKTLWRHRKDLGAPMNIKLQSLQQKLWKESASRGETNQTPLIPSRIYCAILAGLNTEMDRLAAKLDDLLEAYAIERTVSRNTPKGLSKKQILSFRKKQLEAVAKKMELLGYDSKIKLALNAFIEGQLLDAQTALMLAVVAWSGMRKSEVLIMPLEGCLSEFESLGSKHYELNGYTHKFNNGVKCKASWITSREGARAVRLAQRIGRAIAHQNGVALGNEASSEGSKKREPLLFGSSANPCKKISDNTLNTVLSRLRERLCPQIEAGDMDELNRLEFARGWEKDGIGVGDQWPLAMHQLRRSLAVYAHRSGMVTLPALKAQLQHIMAELTLYYGDGFTRAVNLVHDQDHFSHAWKAAQAESSYFAYIFAVVLSDDELLGQGVLRLADAVEKRSREDTVALFRQGKIAYTETPLGACISTEPCKTDPLEPIPYDCLESNCPNLVAMRKRLDMVIKSQEIAVAHLERTEHGSVEHRMEAKSLEVLLNARKNLIKGPTHG